jgi:hypothetical protein
MRLLRISSGLPTRMRFCGLASASAHTHSSMAAIGAVWAVRGMSCGSGNTGALTCNLRRQ